jgi:hypothetical protein
VVLDDLCVVPKSTSQIKVCFRVPYIPPHPSEDDVGKIGTVVYFDPYVGVLRKLKVACVYLTCPNATVQELQRICFKWLREHARSVVTE